MKNTLVLLSLIFLLGACKKDEEIHECPEPYVTYTSIRNNGDTADKVRVSILSGSNENQECTGYFMMVQGTDSLVDKGVNMYKIINPIPDSIKNNTNYGNTEWLVDVTYLGVGIECLISAQFKDPVPGGIAYPDNIELVEVTNFEPYQ
ncbi:MAG: hypothetical protein ACI9GM_001130 [Salibacteraceae bacterium]|jgi:hypothetical protein